MTLLQIDNLRVTLAAREVLAGVACALAAGEVVALIGANGCGKTTLLRAALGYVPYSGSVAWEGQPLAAIARKTLSQRVAYLPQAPTVEPGDTVLDVLRLGRSPFGSVFGIEREGDETIVQTVAADLGLLDLLPRPIESLSGGQRQRVLLGRCLVQTPRALLLDEPATFLDLRHQVDLHRLLARLARERGIGVLMASHDLNLAAAHSDRCVVMKAGRVLAQGPTDEVLTEAVLSEAFDVPIRSAQIDGERVFSVPSKIA